MMRTAKTLKTLSTLFCKVQTQRRMSKVHLSLRPKNAGLSILRNNQTQLVNQPKFITNNQKRLSISTWYSKLTKTTTTSCRISTPIASFTKDFHSFTKDKSLLRGYNLFSNHTLLARTYATEKQQIVDPQTKQTVETLFRVGLKHLQMRDFAEAVPVFNDLANMVQGPTKVPALVFKAMALFELGIIDIANQILDEALSLASRHVVGRVYKGACLVGLGKLQEAYGVLKSVKDEWEKVKDQLDFRAQTVFFLNYALASCEMGLVDESLDSFDKLDSLDPRAISEIFSSSFIRGACYMQKEQWQKAVECFDKELAEIPKVPSEKITTSDIVTVHRECLMNRATALTELKRYPEALENWDGILKMFTGNSPMDMTSKITAWENKANIYLEMKKPVEALHAAEETKRLIQETEKFIAKHKEIATDETHQELKKKAAEKTRIVEESMAQIRDQAKKPDKKETEKKAKQEEKEKEWQKIFEEIEKNPAMYDMVSQMYLRGPIPQIYHWIQTRARAIGLKIFLLLLVLLLLMVYRNRGSKKLPASEEEIPPSLVPSTAEVVENAYGSQKQ